MTAFADLDDVRERLFRAIDERCAAELQRIAAGREHHRRALGQLFRLDRVNSGRPH